MEIYLSGYEIKNPLLKHWSLLLEEWICCFDKLCQYSGTTPFWNCREKSNYGPFIGAIWRIGWIAFPEIKCKRSTLGGYGQVDLYVSSADGNIHEYIEVKGNAVSNVFHAKHSLQDSIRHASTIDDKNVTLKIGVTFSNIEIRTENKTEIENLSKILLLQIKEQIEYDLIAWSFPEKIRNYDEVPGVFTPGVILLAKIAKN